jgi:tetratricopeptide (TPR) repeat protein
MQETFAQLLERLLRERGLSVRDVAGLASVGKSTVSALANGTRKPSPQIAAALDHALGANGLLMDSAASSGKSPLERAADLQRGLMDTLTAGPLNGASVEEWEYTVARHGRATRYRPADEHLEELTRDFGDLNRLLQQRHPTDVRRKLLIAAAHMSGLVALTLLKMGDPASSDWWRTGRAAASRAEDRASLSWIYAHESYEHYYAGNLEGAIELARRAQSVAGALPCVGPALAAPLEARAHGLRGHREEAAAALARAQQAFDRLAIEGRTASALGYNESQLAFHSGNAWTHLGETLRAREFHNRALELYPASDLSDRAFVRLDEATCLAIDGDLAGAATYAANTVTELPPEHRNALIISRAHELSDAVTSTDRALPEVRLLREVLALPPGERNESHD